MSDTLPSLITALAGLSAVRAVTGAINANLPKNGPLGTIPPASNPHTPQPRPKLNQEPETRIAPQPVFHPQPRFDPRFVIHPDPKIEDLPPQYAAPLQESVHQSNSPIQPPWKTLPWPEMDPVIIEPKVFHQTVDLIHKGTLLDLFI